MPDFGPQDLAGIIRRQLHGGMFTTWSARVTSVDFGKKLGTLIVGVRFYPLAQTDLDTFKDLTFTIRIDEVKSG